MKKYQDIQRRRNNPASPLKRSSTTPNFRSKAEQVLDEDVDDREEDEETLQLQLAEIQARLKLKQLQKSRGRSGSNVDDGEDTRARPASAISSSSRSRDYTSTPRSTKGPSRKANTDDVQVPVSPTRKELPSTDPLSPRRYLMGIDKGWKGSDVSLKRPPSSRADPRPNSQLGSRDGLTPRSNDLFAARPHSSAGGGGAGRIKSFSERMAEGRAAEKAEKSRMERAEKVKANRSSGFQLDSSEMESFKAAAAEAKNSPPSFANRARQPESFSREDILRSLGQSRPAGLHRSQTTPSVRRMDSADPKDRQSQLHRRNHTTESEAVSSREKDHQHGGGAEGTGPLKKAPDASKFESYSSLHLSNRVLPHSFLSRNLGDKTILRIPDLLRTIKAPAFELPEEIDGDFVVFGIVASKSDPKEVKNSGNASAKPQDPYDDGLNNTSRYMVMTLTDLKWTVDLFLFDTAFPRYYKVSEGTLIAILNPTIMPPPKHKLDTNRFSLALSSSDDKVLEIGYSRDIGFCKAVRKDGKTCQSWVDGRKTEYCDFHVDIQVRRTQGQRMGVNSGTGMFGPGGGTGQRTGIFGSEGGKKGDGRGGGSRHGLRPEGAQYDWGSQSLYYVAPAPKNRGSSQTSFSPTPGKSAASLIDASDDPFIAAGMMGRGMENKEERLRRRLATQQRERDITQKLVSGRVGGVGAEYLRSRTANENPSADASQEKTLGTPTTPKALPSTNGISLSSFGKANNVRLSPKKRAHDGDKPHGSGVKKTRFITAKGIREAGRDSLGVPTMQRPQKNRLYRTMMMNWISFDGSNTFPLDLSPFSLSPFELETRSMGTILS
ncbi:hypothetical protein NUU61_004834 [Penicillium alfredii]|uniref:Zinc finger Mcm10/DnaG-type domain-containing protein n=1 Tax=Penicillium alfredii TaxID=1506179 RepID=A0A9W9F8B4_9EURO|nr:uncharacterized protein NUU61_004834 [Penicillium alfredii]KAJ5095478.1 hypothetical protein NUU61_004834 [Penicillium alfredii]